MTHSAARQLTAPHHVGPPAVAPVAAPARYSATGPRAPQRTPYPCTHCQSTDHIDPQCPQNPRRLRTATKAALLVPAYWVDPAVDEDVSLAPDAMIDVLEELYNTYEAHFDDVGAENGLSGS